MKYLKHLLFISILCSLVLFTNCDKEEATCAICDDYRWSMNGIPVDTFKNSLTRCVGHEYLLGTVAQKEACRSIPEDCPASWGGLAYQSYELDQLLADGYPIEPLDLEPYTNVTKADIQWYVERGMCTLIEE